MDILEFITRTEVMRIIILFIKFEFCFFKTNF